MTQILRRGAIALATATIALSSMPATWAQSRPTPKKPAPAPSTALYDKAAKELPKDVYTLYRIVDRIARANSLDERPWRIALVQKYDINAFATDVNLIAVYSGLMDQLAGDTSAIACVIGHEMAHNAKRHIAVGEAQRAAEIERIKKETEAEVMKEANAAQTEATATAVAGGLLGSLGGTLGNLGGGILQNASARRIEAARAKIPQIVQKKQEELDKRLAETQRAQEFEADEAGYLYVAKAGFEGEGCLRAMEVLARTPGAEFDTTHPSVPKRVEGLKALMKKNPAASLAAQGKAKINASQPLTYELSQDKVSLRINSRFSGSNQSDFDRLFGK